jgi:peptide/nickel transport system permease protein
MFGYVVRRLIGCFLVIVATSMITFTIFFLSPTNGAEVLCNQNGRCTQERLALIEHQLGYDQPLYEQYAVWVNGIFTGRTIEAGATYECSAPCLGISFDTKTEVSTDLASKYPATLSLAIGGATIYLLVGVTLGVLSARRRGTFTDRALVSSTLVVSSVPYYILALMAWLFLVNSWGLFSDTSYTPLTEDPVQWFKGLLLPWLVLGFWGSTQYARFSRGAMVETLSEDYVRTATAKGVPTRRVTTQHALRAAIVPIITIFGLDFAALLAGTIFTEYIFGIDGIGVWGLQAISTFDFPVIAATVLVAAVIIVLANLAVDLVYSVIDPRVRLV